MNQALQDVIEHRRTTNVFEPNHTISDEQIEHLVHLATRAPTRRIPTHRYTLRIRR
jgi:nitroreductase